MVELLLEAEVHWSASARHESCPFDHFYPPFLLTGTYTSKAMLRLLFWLGISDYWTVEISFGCNHVIPKFTPIFSFKRTKRERWVFLFTIYCTSDFWVLRHDFQSDRIMMTMHNMEKETPESLSSGSFRRITWFDHEWSLRLNIFFPFDYASFSHFATVGSLWAYSIQSEESNFRWRPIVVKELW